MSSFLLNSCSDNPSVKGFEVSNLDTSVKPSDDFYQFSVGNWVKNNPVPDDQSIWAAFTVLREQTNDQVKLLVETVAKDKSAKDGSIAQKVRDFYNTGMNIEAINSNGIKPIKPILDKIDSIENNKDLARVAAYLHKYTSAPFFYFGSSQDSKNSEWVIASITQGGLGLPDRDYYVKDDERSKEIREKYVDHIMNIFVLAGVTVQGAKKNAETVMAIETELAKNSKTRTERRDPEKNYNKVSYTAFKNLAPDFKWDVFFSELGSKNFEEINAGQPEFFEALNKQLKSVPLNNWKTYLKWEMISSMANYLSNNFVDESFDFNGKFMSGSKVNRPRWKRVLASLNGSMGEAVGQLYVKEYFPPEAKTRAKTIVESILVTMGESIKNNSWMSETTKEQALVKLKTFKVKIGYPDKWTDYSVLNISSENFVDNIMQSNSFAVAEDLKKIDGPVDKGEWFFPPQTVNAYYHPVLNEIVFPAAILQSPFYNYQVDDAINYGAMGAVIGHEITHGFDDQGMQYDAEGNLKNWWTEEDKKQFGDRAKVIIDQFNSYVAIDNENINGELTQGENIADIGGLTISYAAFKKTEQFKNNEKIDGFSPAQRFFLSWANVWKNNIRDEELKLRLKTDVHSPGKWRVLGPLANMPEFYKAFDVKEGDAMRRASEERVKIW